MASIFGTIGNDSLVGGIGNDTLNGGAGDDTYYINGLNDHIYDSAGDDKAIVSVSFAKIPSYIEDVEYINSAQALPYWISALLFDKSNGNYYTNLISSDKTFLYTFPDTIPEYDDDADRAIGWTSFSQIQQENAVKVLTYVETIIDVKFEETNNSSQFNTISMAYNDQENSSGYARAPSKNSFTGNDVWLSNNDGPETWFNAKDYNSTLAEGTIGSNVIVHELGHAFGLKHPFTKDGNISPPPHLLGDEDHGKWTMMSYAETTAEYKHTYSPLDIAALQYLYGVSETARTGNDTYVINENTYNFIWDGNGTDTINASALSQGTTVYLSEGYHGFVGPTKDEKITAVGQITVNFGTVIENLTGSNFDDKLYGNSANNNITGNNGNNSLIF
jgi:serralysin